MVSFLTIIFMFFLIVTGYGAYQCLSHDDEHSIQWGLGLAVIALISLLHLVSYSDNKKDMLLWTEPLVILSENKENKNKYISKGIDKGKPVYTGYVSTPDGYELKQWDTSTSKIYFSSPARIEAHGEKRTEVYIYLFGIKVTEPGESFKHTLTKIFLPEGSTIENYDLEGQPW